MTSPDGGTTKGVMDVSPYGGESIAWIGDDFESPDPDSSPTSEAASESYGSGKENKRAIFSKYQTSISIYDQTYGEVGVRTRKSLLESQVPSGYVFVLTITLKFPFSSLFVAKLFNGGSNKDKPGVYILWARGSGMIN